MYDQHDKQAEEFKTCKEKVFSSELATLKNSDGIGCVDIVTTQNGDCLVNYEAQVIVEDCALACLKLEFLNRFRSPRWVLAFLSLAACLQGLSVNGLVNVVITSIERRFGLQSTQSGIISSSYDIGSLIIIIPVSFLGGKASASKPKWIASGMLVMGLGSFVWTLPHFSTLPYTTNVADTEENLALCGTGEGDIDCGVEIGAGSLPAYRFVFLLGQLLHGIGSAPLVVLGTAFLDESVDTRDSPLYIAIFHTWFLFGPAIGYILGGLLLSIHTDFLNDSGLTPESSLWVGAWWPGFLLTFVLSIICSFCIFCYPDSINRKKNTCIKTTKSKDSQSTMKLLPIAVWSLVSNPTYMFVCLASGLDGFLVSGLATFLPKFIEKQYQLPNGLAAQIVGLIVIPAGGGGTFLGGWLIKKLNLSRQNIIFMCFISQLVAIPFAFAALFSCSNPLYVGVNQKHNSNPTTHHYSLPNPIASSSSPYLSSCNTNCSCSTNKFDPMCGSDSLMYLSPCHAGCTMRSPSNIFTNCACILEGGGTAERTTCDNNCRLHIPFFILQFMGIFLTFLALSPAVVASLRCVHEHEKSLGLGLNSIISKLVGSIPGPVLFGYFLDRSCILWEPTCGGAGSCLLYNNHQMSTSIFAICITVKVISVLFYGFSWLASKRSSVSDEKQEYEDKLQLEHKDNKSISLSKT